MGAVTLSYHPSPPIHEESLNKSVGWKQRWFCAFQGKVLSLLLCLLSSSIMNEFGKRIPIAIHLNAAELQQVFCPLFDPAHTAAVEALGDDVIHCALDRPRRNLQILLAQFLVVHLIHMLIEL